MGPAIISNATGIEIFLEQLSLILIYILFSWQSSNESVVERIVSSNSGLNGSSNKYLMLTFCIGLPVGDSEIKILFITESSGFIA